MKPGQAHSRAEFNVPEQLTSSEKKEIDILTTFLKREHFDLSQNIGKEGKAKHYSSVYAVQSDKNKIAQGKAAEKADCDAHKASLSMGHEKFVSESVTAQALKESGNGTGQ